MAVRARCGRFQEEECWLQQEQEEEEQGSGRLRFAAAAAAAAAKALGISMICASAGALCGVHIITCFRFAAAASLGTYPRFIFITVLWFALH